MKSVMRCERVEVADARSGKLEALLVGVASFTRLDRLYIRAEKGEFQPGQTYRVTIGPITPVEAESE